MSPRDEKRLEDMLRVIASIEEHCPTGEERLESRGPLLSHVVLKLMHVGEADSSCADPESVTWSGSGAKR